jgi:hypothetical protein
MSVWKLRLGLNPFTLLLLVIVGLCCVVGYFYLLSFLLSDGSPYQDDGKSRRRLLESGVSVLEETRMWTSKLRLPSVQNLFEAPHAH